MLKTFSTMAAATLLSFGLAPATLAGTLHNSWTYSIDAFDDGSGGSGYEIQGLAFRETADSLLFAIAGGAPLTGVSATEPEDGNIGWTDLMLNFSGRDYHTAADRGELFGLHFATGNDSGVDRVGLYQVDAAIAVYAENNGYGSLKAYYDAGWSRPDTMGDLATEQAAFEYFGETTAVRSSIGHGTYLGGLTLLTTQAATAEGLDFASVGIDAPETHILQVDRTRLPADNFIASVFLECINDGIALYSSREGVPEPSALGGLLLVGGLTLRYLQRRSPAP